MLLALAQGWANYGPQAKSGSNLFLEDSHLSSIALECLQVLWLISLVQFSRSVLSDSLRPHESQHARPPCPSQTPGVYSNSCPSSRWCHPPISSSVVPFPSQHQGLFQWVSSSHEVAKVLEFLNFSVSPWTLTTYLLQDGLVGSPFSPRDS